VQGLQIRCTRDYSTSSIYIISMVCRCWLECLNRVCSARTADTMHKSSKNSIYFISMVLYRCWLECLNRVCSARTADTMHTSAAQSAFHGTVQVQALNILYMFLTCIAEPVPQGAESFSKSQSHNAMRSG
jgi:hypothetical protein